VCRGWQGREGGGATWCKSKSGWGVFQQFYPTACLVYPSEWLDGTALPLLPSPDSAPWICLGHVLSRSCQAALAEVPKRSHAGSGGASAAVPHPLCVCGGREGRVLYLSSLNSLVLQTLESRSKEEVTR